ncbi:MAG: 2-succinyl-5-enolpyruvyl-6-hydroxy-3-cyclohexene-1-carboxylic-acid synthase [Candidatus Didemnitutus sp.]|nr:2-succinyl-5-enolpyruvyl-6-hydroxy-3-cyclohexene-1-carboxylic-acid synthase [Candidatus Didemnitutus sp.]
MLGLVNYWCSFVSIRGFKTVVQKLALDFRNVNSLWGSVLVETLARLGVRQAVISPGSRSTPLTVQFAAHPAFEAIPVLDERSAAFFALGLARQSHRPVVLLCTSGTAGANYFPAIIEARESGVPLIVITADRPPEMRECRSGQTIDQQKLFGGYVNFYHELCVPEASVAMLRYLRQTVTHAVERSQWPVGGPVHLNAPFRDPLPPVKDESAEALKGGIGEKFFAHLEAPAAAATADKAVSLGGRGVIVAGQLRVTDAAAYARVVGKLAKRLGWPVLADALSPLRNFAALVPGLITRYDVIARSAEWAKELQPSHVVCLHDWPTSKPLRQWLQAGDVPVTFVTTRTDNPDALHSATRVVRSDVASFVAKVRARPASRDWARRWSELERRVEGRLRRGLAEAEGIFEGQAMALLPRALPKDATVMFANSMPVRDAEYLWPANDCGHAVHCNRGANGIDGTLSTAIGLAHRGAPTVLVTGDLALLHDTNGFLLARELRGSLTVVLINNDGGGIFGHLPVAQFEPPFERFFATPQSVDFAKLCATYGVGHTLVRDWRHFERLLAKLPSRGVRVLEVRTDRKRDAATRKALFAAAAR